MRARVSNSRSIVRRRSWRSSICFSRSGFSLAAGRLQPGIEFGLGLIERGGGLGMHRHGRIAEHRLRPRRGQGHAIRLAGLGIDDGIVEIPETARHGLVKDLVIADGCLQHRVPVHQPLAAIDQPVAEHLEERVPHRPGALRIEREAGPLPIAATAHLLELAEDPLFVVVLPLPDPGHEPFAAQLVPAELLLLQQAAFDDRLRGNARVIGAGIQRTSKPCIRFWRMRMSCSVLFRAWPRCRAPVTLGGGMTIE